MACINVASGTQKSIIWQREDGCWGELPTVPVGQTIRRVTGNFNLSKEQFSSEELRVDHQMVDFRHGVRSVEGSINGELSPGTYSDFIAAALSRDFTAGTGETGLTVDISDAGAPIYTITRAAGDFTASDLKVGMVVRLSGANAANNGKNLLIVAMTTTVMSVIVLNGGTLVNDLAATPVSITAPGKATYIPSTGHTDVSYTVEEWYNDIGQSEVTTGNKVNTVGISLPATGLVTADFAFMGKDLVRAETTKFFTNPTAQGDDRVFASVSGALIIDGVPVSLVTSLSININKNLTSEAVVGSNVKPTMEFGRILVDGEFSAMLSGKQFADAFRDEKEIALVCALTTGTENDAQFMTITLPRIKINSDTKNDGEQAIVSTHSFQALKGDGTSGFVASTIMIQDSAA